MEHTVNELCSRSVHFKKSNVSSLKVIKLKPKKVINEGILLTPLQKTEYSGFFCICSNV